MHSKIPTKRANKMASSICNSPDESAIPPKALETRRDTNATGPIASWRDEPNTAYTNIGTKEESASKVTKLNQTDTNRHFFESRTEESSIAFL